MAIPMNNPVRFWRKTYDGHAALLHDVEIDASLEDAPRVYIGTAADEPNLTAGSLLLETSTDPAAGTGDLVYTPYYVGPDGEHRKLVLAT